MKKIVLFAGLLCFLMLGSFTASAQNRVTEATEGGVLARGSETMPVQKNMDLQPGDVLKTGEKCQVDISMQNMAGCRILSGSECAVITSSPESMELKVMTGNVILNLKKLPKESTFKVETPTAIAAVRGTQFWGRVDNQQSEDPVTTFAVRQGSVVVQTKKDGQIFALEKGQAIDIPLSSAAPFIRPALDEEMNAMEQADSIPTGA